MNKNFMKQSTPNNGFTLIELIVVILLISILAAFIVPRLNLGAFRQSGFEQQARATIRYGQKQAIGSGCEVNVSITAGGCTLQWNGTPALMNCPAANTFIFPITSNINPLNVNDFCVEGTPGTTADLPTVIRFDKIGRPTAIVNDLNINIGTTIIVVHPETGFAQ